jgi:hypothetical protein
MSNVDVSSAPLLTQPPCSGIATSPSHLTLFELLAQVASAPHHGRRSPLTLESDLNFPSPFTNPDWRSRTIRSPGEHVGDLGVEVSSATRAQLESVLSTKAGWDRSDPRTSHATSTLQTFFFRPTHVPTYVNPGWLKNFKHVQPPVAKHPAM